MRIVRRPRAHLVASLMVLIVLAGCVEPGPLQLRRSQDAAGFRRKLRRICRDGAPFPVELDRFPSTCSSSRHTTCGRRRPLPIWSRWRSGSASFPASRWSGASPGRRVNPLEQARATYQAGEVGNKLDDASNQINDHTGDLDRLANGADQLADGLGDVRGQVSSGHRQRPRPGRRAHVHAGPIRRRQDAQGQSTTPPNWSPACARSATPSA